MKKKGCDEKERSERQIPMSINMPQLIFQRAESAPPSHHSSSIWWAVLVGEGGLLLGGGGGGGNPRFPTPLYEILQLY